MVAVEVAHRHRNGSGPDTEVHGGLESSVAVAQQHADVLLFWFATTRSGLRSPLKSPTATYTGKVLQ